MDAIKTCGQESPDTFKIVEIGDKFRVRPVQCTMPKDHKPTVPHHYETEWNR